MNDPVSAAHLKPVPTPEDQGAEPGPGGGEPGPKTEGGITPPRRREGRSRFLGDVVVELGYTTRERAEAAVEEARNTGRKTGDVLLEWGAITPEQHAHSLAERFGLDYVDFESYQVDLSAVNTISPQAARRFGAVPVGYAPDGALLVAISDPTNVLALDDLKLMTGNELRPVVASPDDIETLIGKMSTLGDAVAEAVEEEDEAEEFAITDIRESAEDAPVIKLVNSVIAEAVQSGASDIHFEPEEKDMRVRFRIDGVLVESTTIPRKLLAGVISRVKIMAHLDIAERRLPQDGRVTLNVEGNAVDIRIVTMPSVLGEGIVMRLLDKRQELLTLDTLGMNEHARARFEGGFKQSYGAVLVTGPTGSGKSTTLYAAINTLNSIDRNIITIEDPVEYQLGGITQVQVNAKFGLTFARGLRSMLRADPDVIMVGEIRDAETARIAVESALTGHLVLSTLHTNDAPSALTRLTEMGIEPFLTASAVDVVVAQRLARTLCKHCKRHTIIDGVALAAAGFPSALELEGYEPVGCARCRQTGYRGRVGVYEVMVVDDHIRKLTIERASADEIAKAAVEQGMSRLRDDGLDKVARGLTSIAEIARIT